MNFEKQAEELLEAMGNELHKSRLEKFSEIDKHALEIKKKRRDRHTRRFAWVAIFCICILITGTATVTSDAFRATVLNIFFSEETDGHRDLLRKGDAAQTIGIQYPEFLPDGYEKTEETFDGTISTLIYDNQKTGDSLSIMQVRDKNFSVSVDSETSQYETCIVKTHEAYYIGGNETHMLLWEEEDCYFEITSGLEKEIMIKVADSLKK